MNLLRAFIAVEIPFEIRAAIGKAMAPLQTGIGSIVRWVPTDNMHLTLKFLGDVSPGSVEMLSQMLGAEADMFNCFDVGVGGLGSFPSLKRPRVIFIGIQAPPTLEALQRGIESASRRLGYESEARGFSAHLTIGRLRQNARATEQQALRRRLEETRIDSLGTARVDSVHLYKSDLRPTGSLYTCLYSAPLRKS